MWARHLTAFLVFAALVVLVVVFVDSHQSPLTATPAPANKQQQAAENRQDAENVAAQQAPHTAPLTGSGTAAAVHDAVAGYMRSQTGQGFIKGPYQRTHCHAIAGSRFSCRVSAGGLNYPFLAVAGTSRITYCQVVTPPYPLRPIPVSRRCR